MENKFYIHIGMNKTGSSAIQAFLTLNANVLKRNGYVYPDPPQFTQAFQTNSGNGAGLAKRINEGSLGGYKKYIERHLKGHHLILSSEALYPALRDHPAFFLESVMKYDFRIICYVRRQDNLISSSYNQVVKNHNYKKPTINETLVNANDFSKPLLKALDYASAERIMIRPYEKQQFQGGNIYSDFLSCLGLELNGEFVYPEQVVNPSFNWESLEFRRILNEFEVDRDNLENKKFINSLLAEYTVDKNNGRPFQDTNIFSFEERKDLMARFEEGNKKIAETFLQDRDGPLFKEPIPETDSPWLNDDKLNLEKTIDICRYLLSRNGLSDQTLVPGLISETANLLLHSANRKPGIPTNATLLYQLKNIPTRLSKDIAVFERKFGLWYIESTGNDPFFVLPGFTNEKKAQEIFIKIQITVPFECAMQVFYIAEEGKFDSTHCTGQILHKGYNEVVLTIQAKQDIKKLRLDPGNKEGIYLLHLVEVYANV